MYINKYLIHKKYLLCYLTSGRLLKNLTKLCCVGGSEIEKITVYINNCQIRCWLIQNLVHTHAKLLIGLHRHVFNTIQ